jgi:hypothetical protein
LRELTAKVRFARNRSRVAAYPHDAMSSRATALGGVVIALVAMGGALWHCRTRGEAPASLKAGVPVIVEIFSAEGCSSCPPADAYVAALDRDQPIDGISVIALELHVDYWDRLGWKDPFGSHEFAERQAAYARLLPDKRVYTPEIVIDGNKQMVGGDEDRARDQMLASAREAKARVLVERTGRGEVDVSVDEAPPVTPGDAFDVWLAVTESHLASEPNAGENRGRTLAHAPIARRLTKLGSVEAGAFRKHAEVELPSSWKPGALRYVAFVQEAGTKRIVGAAACNARD